MFALTVNSRWQPGIGDPSLMGWVTVAGYFGAALLCLRTAWVANTNGTSAAGRRWFWLLFAGGFVLLGANKQLDLQTWLTFVGKRLAQETGWYEQRRAIQAAFIVVITLIGAAALAGIRRLAGRASPAMLLALAGAIFLLSFVIIRAASFHHVDQMLGMDLGGLKVNWLLELGSILCVAFGALLDARSRARPPVSYPSSIGPPASNRSKRPEPHHISTGPRGTGICER